MVKRFEVFGSRVVGHFVININGKSFQKADDRFRVRISCWADHLWEEGGTWEEVTGKMKKQQISPHAFDLLEKVFAKLHDHERKSGCYVKLNETETRCLKVIGPGARTIYEISEKISADPFEVARALRSLIEKGVLDLYMHDKEKRVFLTSKGVVLGETIHVGEISDGFNISKRGA